MRNYISTKNYDSALNLISKTNFPVGRNYNELIRFLYYTGKLKAIQGEYQEAFEGLNQAIRKSPDSNAALGFRVTSQRIVN